MGLEGAWVSVLSSQFCYDLSTIQKKIIKSFEKKKN